MTAPEDFATTVRLSPLNALTETDLASYDAIANRTQGPGARVNLGAAFAAQSPGFHAVRAVTLNKTPANNRAVPLHQNPPIPAPAQKASTLRTNFAKATLPAPLEWAA